MKPILGKRFFLDTTLNASGVCETNSLADSFGDIRYERYDESPYHELNGVVAFTGCHDDYTPYDPSEQRAVELAELFLSDIERDGGSTRSFKDHSAPEKGKGLYVVSFREPTLVSETTSLEVVVQFIMDAKASGMANDSTNLGGWRDENTGLLHLDISVVLPCRESATILGKAMGQLAIYDIDSGESLYL